MEYYRRPASRPRTYRADTEGFIPAKTKIADKTTQPYRHAAETAEPIKAQPIEPARTRHPKFDMELDGDEFNRHHMTPLIRRNTRRLRLLFMRSAIAVMALLVLVGGGLLSQGYLNLHRIFKGTAASAAALQNDVDPNLLKGEGDGRINVLLTGIGGPGHDGGDLTDTLMLASIDPVNNSASLLSVPRDLWVTIPGKGSMKINAAYATAKYAYMHKNNVDANDSKAVQAGFSSIDQTIEQVLGVPVNYNLLVNFQAFRQAVDTVGGVTVDVPTDLYDPTMAWENNYNPYLAKAGRQNFDGKHALIYVRSRETSSDFARSERQRAVLLALKQKAISLGVVANPTKLSGLMNAFGSNVQTDMSLSDASRLYSIFKRIDNSKIQSVSLAGTTTTTSSAAGSDSLITTGNLNGQSIVMPKAGLENYDAIQEFVRGHLTDGYILKEHARVLLVNVSSSKTLGDTVATKLKSYGYNVIGVQQGSAGGYTSTQVVDLSHGKDKYTRHYLEQRYDTTAVTSLPSDSGVQTTTADFVVLLNGDTDL